MLLDCDTCVVRDLQCDDCVVTVLLGGPPGARAPMTIDEGERQALDVLADSGLVPRLRLVAAASPADLAAAQAAHAVDPERGTG